MKINKKLWITGGIIILFLTILGLTLTPKKFQNLEQNKNIKIRATFLSFSIQGDNTEVYLCDPNTNLTDILILNNNYSHTLLELEQNQVYNFILEVKDEKLLLVEINKER